jgi:S-adenosylmethionine decarboxylase
LGRKGVSTRANPSAKQEAGRVCRHAGTHILLEFWEAENLDDVCAVEGALTEAVKACGAQLLKVMVHKFSPKGVCGVAVLCESHISIHTWPEYGYAALDIFTGGRVDAHAAIPTLRKAFAPKRAQMSEHKRGMML